VNLLYVGISINPFKRLDEHKHSSEWFNFVKNVTIQSFDNREEALSAETIAIVKEKPAYNIKKTKEKNQSNKEQEKFKRIQENKDILTRRVVFKTTYSINEAAKELSISVEKIKEYIKSKKIGSICVGEKINWRTGLKQKQHAITGWHLMEFIENLEQENNAS
jgi:predicted GIY-YIG superfamily endonuclease